VKFWSKISIGCQKIAFCPVGHVILSHLCIHSVAYAAEMEPGLRVSGSPGQQFGSGSGRVTGQSPDPAFDRILVQCCEKL